MTSSSPSSASPSDPGIFKVVAGMAISGGLAFLFVRLLQSIFNNLPPIAVDGSPLSRSLSIGVRYMLVGSIGLLAFMFSMVTIGLLAYTVQLVWLSLTAGNEPDSDGRIETDIAAIVEEEKQAGESTEPESPLEGQETEGDAAKTA